MLQSPERSQSTVRYAVKNSLVASTNDQGASLCIDQCRLTAVKTRYWYIAVNDTPANQSQSERPRLPWSHANPSNNIKRLHCRYCGLQIPTVRDIYGWLIWSRLCAIWTASFCYRTVWSLSKKTISRHLKKYTHGDPDGESTRVMVCRGLSFCHVTYISFRIIMYSLKWTRSE